MDFFLSLPRVQELSPPNRNLNGKQWALMLSARQEWPTGAQGRRGERVSCNLLLFLLASVNLTHHGSLSCCCRIHLSLVQQ